MNILSVRNLSFAYKKSNHIINNLSFDLEKGDFLCVVGSNGAGKSTLIKCISKQLKNYQGTINFSPKSIKWGIIADNICLPTELTIMELAKFVLNIKKSVNNEKIDEVLANLNLFPYKEYKICNLSSGIRKKVEILLLLLCEDELLLLDEPTNALDTDTRESINNIFKQLNKTGKTIIYTTHILSDIEDLYTKLLFIIDEKYYLYDKKDLKINQNEMAINIKKNSSLQETLKVLKSNNIKYRTFENILIFNTSLCNYSTLMDLFIKHNIEIRESSIHYISINMLYHNLINKKGEIKYVIE